MMLTIFVYTLLYTLIYIIIYIYTYILGLLLNIEDTWGGDIVTATIASLAQSTPSSNLLCSTDFNSYGPKRIGIICVCLYIYVMLCV